MIMKKRRARRKRTKKDYLKLGLAVFALLVLLFVVWANIFYYRNCENQTCFNDYLEDCKGARFISQGDMTFEYKILGRSSGNCVVNVRLLQGDLSEQDLLKVEGKQMKCELPLGLVAVPQSDIGNCHGELREGLQDLIISKLHKYIVQNLGEINEGLLGV